MSSAVFEVREGEVVFHASRSKLDSKGVFPRIPRTSPAQDLYEDATVSGTGTLYSFTVMHPSPKTGKPPFVLGLVDFDGQTRVLGRLRCAPETVKIGMQVAARAAEDEGAPSYFFEASEEGRA